MTSWLTNSSFAHRGLHGRETGCVENSPAAFELAIKEGFGFELDVLLSKDHRAVVIHDETLDRLAGQDRKVIDLPAEEFKKVKLLGSDDHIPTLAEILKMTAARAPILIEIKGDQGEPEKISQAVWQDIEDYRGEVAIMSFYPDIVSYFQNTHGDVPRGLVATPLDDGGLPTQYFDEDYQIELINSLAIDFIAYDIRAIPNKVTRYCQLHNIPVLTWTVRSEENRKIAHAYTDAIIFENN